MKKENTQPKIISDIEMNKIVANHVIEMIENRDYCAWRKTWTCKPNTLNEFYYKVANGEMSATIYSMQLFNPTLYGLPVEIKEGFYLTFAEIKAHSLKLKKGSKGVPTYKPAVFEKFLNKEQKLVFEMLLNNTDLCESEEQKADFEKLKENPTKPTRISFYFGANKTLFREEVYFNKYKKDYVYKKFAWVLVYYFNNEDLEKPVDVKKLWGITDKEIINDNKRIEIAEKVKDSYIERANLQFNEVFQDQAFYSPAKHSVTVPKLSQFENSNEYYQTLFHEFAHSTGHRSLLNRATLVGNQGFGSITYSKEELVAELSSTFTLNSLGLLTEAIIKNTISYLAGWGSNLKEGIRYNILNTIMHSQKATNLILNINNK